MAETKKGMTNINLPRGGQGGGDSFLYSNLTLAN